MAVFRVRQYRSLQSDGNTNPVGVPLEPAVAVTQIDTGSAAQTVGPFTAGVKYIVVEQWSGSATHIKYHFAGSSPDVTDGTAGKAPIELTAVTFGVREGDSVELLESI